MALFSFGTQNVQPGSLIIFTCLKRNVVLCVNANISWYWLPNKYMSSVLLLYPLTVVGRSEGSPARVRYWCGKIYCLIYGVWPLLLSRLILVCGQEVDTHDWHANCHLGLAGSLEMPWLGFAKRVSLIGCWRTHCWQVLSTNNHSRSPTECPSVPLTCQ